MPRPGGRLRAVREREAADLVAGRRPVLEAVRAGIAEAVVVSRSARATEGLREVLGAAEAEGVPVTRVAPEEVEDLAPGTRHQGVVARIRRPPELDEAGLARLAWPEEALVLVLDGVTDPQNVGAAARAAEAAGAGALVVRRRRGAGVTPSALKASAGALLHLRVARVANVARALRRLKEAGFWVVGLDAEAERTIHDAEPPPGRLALVVGSEGEGLSRLVREACDDLLAIPLRGRVASLNVATAAAVGLFVFAARGRGAT